MPEPSAHSLDLVSPPVSEPSKSQRKAMASAGHLVERFAAACETLRTRVQSGRVVLPESWRDVVVAAPSPTLSEEGWFVLQFAVLTDGKLRLRPEILGDSEAERVITEWETRHPETARAPLLAVPAGRGLPWWTALLRLRQLRDFWEAELRRSAWEQLVALLPDAWLLDATPLPAGAVIPRLELARWDDLPEVISAGRRFKVVRPEGEETVVDSAAAWQGRPESPWRAEVLAEDFADEAGGECYWAIYAKQGSRVDLVEVAGKGRGEHSKLDLPA